jgi:hypothetical protein
MLIIIWLRDFSVDWLFHLPFPNMPVVYGFWSLFLLLLYPLCRAYDFLKQRHPNNRRLGYL